MAAPFNAIARFGKHYKKDVTLRPFEPADEKRLDKRLPEPLLELLRHDGWASYASQLLWTCDPDEWNRAVSPWFPSKRCEVFMRTAFGHFFLWDGEYCWFADAPEASTVFAVEGLDWFLGQYLNPAFLKELGIVADTKRGRKEAGDLAPDEIYMWTPALAMGGSRSDSSLEKAKAIPALAILAELTPISIERV